jgi:hypothetical protein
MVDGERWAVVADRIVPATILSAERVPDFLVSLPRAAVPSPARPTGRGSGRGRSGSGQTTAGRRAGGLVVDDLGEGIDTGARLAFIAHDDETALQADALRARCAGLLVNVVDRPELCDFTTPSLIDRAPVMSRSGRRGQCGARQGSAPAARRLLPQGSGGLALALSAARGGAGALSRHSGPSPRARSCAGSRRRARSLHRPWS